MSKVQELLDTLEDRKIDSPLFELLKDRNRPLAKFIEKYPESPIIKIVHQSHLSGIVELIEMDIDSKDLEVIARDPKLLSRVIQAKNIPGLTEKLTRGSEDMRRRINANGSQVFKLINSVDIKIHEDEYRENFHALFFGTPLSDEERSNRIATWLRVTRSASVPVTIVDDDGNPLFIHPGILSDIYVGGKTPGWENFSLGSKNNTGRGLHDKADFQSDYTNKYAAMMESNGQAMNGDERNSLQLINYYFSHPKGTLSMGKLYRGEYFNVKKDDVKDVRKDVPKEEAKEEWNEDLYD